MNPTELDDESEIRRITVPGGLLVRTRDSRGYRRAEACAIVAQEVVDAVAPELGVAVSISYPPVGRPVIELLWTANEREKP